VFSEVAGCDCQQLGIALQIGNAVIYEDKDSRSKPPFDPPYCPRKVAKSCYAHSLPQAW